MTSSIVLTRPLAINKNQTATGPSHAGLATTVINGQPMLTLADSTRGDKVLSVAEQVHVFSRNTLDDMDWLRLGNASDSEIGFVAEFDGTVVYCTGFCEDTKTESKDFFVYINNVEVTSVGNLTGGENASFTNLLLNVDFNKGDKIRLRTKDEVSSSAGKIEDTVIKLITKHRG